MKNLELYYVVGVMDLRGCVVRCDGIIQRFVLDMRSNNEVINEFK